MAAGLNTFNAIQCAADLPLPTAANRRECGHVLESRGAEAFVAPQRWFRVMGCHRSALSLPPTGRRPRRLSSAPTPSGHRWSHVLCTT
jgi:hypothetical protein